MANILAQKQLRYIILTVSTSVCQSHCAGERWPGVCGLFWDLPLVFTIRARPGAGGCFRIGTDSALLQHLPLSPEGRVILLEEVKQNWTRASAWLLVPGLSFAGKGNGELLGSTNPPIWACSDFDEEATWKDGRSREKILKLQQNRSSHC